VVISRRDVAHQRARIHRFLLLNCCGLKTAETGALRSLATEEAMEIAIFSKAVLPAATPQIRR
jgi:hypothetical protein